MIDASKHCAVSSNATGPRPGAVCLLCRVLTFLRWWWPAVALFLAVREWWGHGRWEVAGPPPTSISFLRSKIITSRSSPRSKRPLRRLMKRSNGSGGLATNARGRDLPRKTRARPVVGTDGCASRMTPSRAPARRFDVRNKPCSRLRIPISRAAIFGEQDQRAIQIAATLCWHHFSIPAKTFRLLATAIVDAAVAVCGAPDGRTFPDRPRGGLACTVRKPAASTPYASGADITGENGPKPWIRAIR